eukprot:TRINITY_DN577_c1_g2_i1.p1 TRINITY_DN577_c1_g2~~TRINITY_DN577_c1_g2_i1.p1  ORF type:complete len:2935 (+),score=1147.57 TRINITY_DN577_c1_g2_i1:91-8895(+)
MRGIWVLAVVLCALAALLEPALTLSSDVPEDNVLSVRMDPNNWHGAESAHKYHTLLFGGPTNDADNLLQQLATKNKKKDEIKATPLAHVRDRKKEYKVIRVEYVKNNDPSWLDFQYKFYTVCTFPNGVQFYSYNMKMDEDLGAPDKKGKPRYGMTFTYYKEMGSPMLCHALKAPLWGVSNMAGLWKKVESIPESLPDSVFKIDLKEHKKKLAEEAVTEGKKAVEKEGLGQKVLDDFISIDYGDFVVHFDDLEDHQRGQVKKTYWTGKSDVTLVMHDHHAPAPFKEIKKPAPPKTPVKESDADKKKKKKKKGKKNNDLLISSVDSDDDTFGDDDDYDNEHHDHLEAAAQTLADVTTEVGSGSGTGSGTGSGSGSGSGLAAKDPSAQTFSSVTPPRSKLEWKEFTLESMEVFHSHKSWFRKPSLFLQCGFLRGNEVVKRLSLPSLKSSEYGLEMKDGKKHGKPAVKKYGKEFIRFYEQYGDLMHCALHKKESGRRLHSKSLSGFKSPLMKEGKVDPKNLAKDHKNKQQISMHAGEGNNKGKSTHAQEKTISYTDEILGFVNVNYMDFQKAGDKMTYTLGDAVFTLTLSKASYGNRLPAPKKEVEELPRHRLYVTVQNAANLENTDSFGGRPDPFATISLGKQMFRTEVRHNKNDPNWAAPFMFTLDSRKQLATDALHIDVKDSDSFFDDLLGGCDFDLSGLKNKERVNKECVLVNPNEDEDDLKEKKSKKDYREPKVFITVMKVSLTDKPDEDIPIPQMKPRPIKATEYRDIQLDRVWIFNPHEGFIRGEPEIFLSCAFPKAPAVRINLFPVLKEDTGTKVIDKAGRQLFTTMMETSEDITFKTDKYDKVKGVYRSKSYYKRRAVGSVGGDSDELLADASQASSRARWGSGDDEKVGLRAQEHGLNFKERTGFAPTIRYYRSYGNMMACSVFESDGQNPTIQMNEPTWWAISFKFTVNNEDADMGHFNVHWNDFDKKPIQQYWTGDSIFNLKSLPVHTPTQAAPIPYRNLWLKSVTLHHPHEKIGQPEMYLECTFPDVTNSPPPLRYSIFPAPKDQIGWHSKPLEFNRPFMKYYSEYDKRMLCSVFETDSAPPINGIQFKVGPIANFQLEVGSRDEYLGQTIVNFDDFENNNEVHYWVGEAEFVLTVKDKSNAGGKPDQKPEEMKEITIDWVKIFNPHWSVTKKMKEKKAWCYDPQGRNAAGAAMETKQDRVSGDTSQSTSTDATKASTSEDQGDETDSLSQTQDAEKKAAQKAAQEKDLDDFKEDTDSLFDVDAMLAADHARAEQDIESMDSFLSTGAEKKSHLDRMRKKRMKKLREKKEAEEKAAAADKTDKDSSTAAAETTEGSGISRNVPKIKNTDRDDYHLDRKCNVPEIYTTCTWPKAPAVRMNLLIDPRRVGMRKRLDAPQQDIKQTFVRYYKSYGNVMVCSVFRARGGFQPVTFDINVAELGKINMKLEGQTFSVSATGVIMPASLGLVVGKDDDHLGTFSVHYEDLMGIDKSTSKRYYTGDSEVSLSLASQQNLAAPPKLPFKDLYLKSVRIYETQGGLYSNLYMSCTTARGPPLRVSFFPIQPETTGPKSTANYFHSKPLFRYYKNYGPTGCGIFRASTKPPLKSIKFGVSLGTFAMDVNHDTRMLGMVLMNYDDIVKAGGSFRYWSGAAEVEVELRTNGDKSGKKDSESASWKDISLDSFRIFNPHESSRPELAMTCTFNTGPAPIRLDFPNLKSDDKVGRLVFPGDKCDPKDATDNDCTKSRNYDPKQWQRKPMVRWYQKYGDTMTCNVVETDYKPPFESLKIAATSFARLSLAVGQQDQILGNFVVNFFDLGKTIGLQQRTYYTGESEWTLGLWAQSRAIDAWEKKSIQSAKVPEYKEIQLMWVQVNNDRTPSFKSTPEIYLTCDPPQAPSFRVNFYPTPADSVGPAKTREVKRTNEKGEEIKERIFSTPGRLTFENEFQPDQKIRQMFRYYKYYGKALTCGLAQKVTNLPLKEFKAGVQLSDKHSLDFAYATDKNGNANVAVQLNGLNCEGCTVNDKGEKADLKLTPSVGFQIGAEDGMLGTFTINYEDFDSKVSERIYSTGDVDLRLRMDHHTNVGNKLSQPKKSAPPSELPDPDKSKKAASTDATAKTANLAVDSSTSDEEDAHPGIEHLLKRVEAEVHDIEEREHSADQAMLETGAENTDDDSEDGDNDSVNVPPQKKSSRKVSLHDVESTIEKAKEVLSLDDDSDTLLQNGGPAFHDITLHSLTINDAHESGTAEVYLTCTFPTSSQIRYNIDISRSDVDKRILYDKPLLRFYKYYGDYMQCMVFESDGKPPINHFSTTLYKEKGGKKDIKASLSIGARDTIMGSFLVNFEDFNGDSIREYWFGDGRVQLRAWSLTSMPQSPFQQFRESGAKPITRAVKESLMKGSHAANIKATDFVEIGLGKVKVFDSQTSMLSGDPDIYVDCTFPNAPNVRFNLANLEKKFWKEGAEPKNYNRAPFVRYYRKYGKTMVCGVWEWDERSIIEKASVQYSDKFKVSTTLAADGTRKIDASSKFNEDLHLRGSVSWNNGDTFLGRFVVNFDDFAGSTRVRNYWTGSVTLELIKRQAIQRTALPRKDIFIKKVLVHNFREAGLPYVSEAEISMRCTHAGLNQTSADIVFPSPRVGFKTIAKDLPWMSLYQSYKSVHCQLMEIDENTMPQWSVTMNKYKLEHKNGVIDFQVPQLHDADLGPSGVVKLKGKKANFGLPFNFVNQKLGSFFLDYNDFSDDKKSHKVWTGDMEIEFEWRQEGGPAVKPTKTESKMLQLRGVRVFKSHDKGLQGLNGVELRVACQFEGAMKEPILFHIPVAKKYINGDKSKAKTRQVDEPFVNFHKHLGSKFVCTVVEKDFVMNVDAIKVALPMGIKQTQKIMKYKDVTMSTITVNYDDFKQQGTTIRFPSAEVELELEWVKDEAAADNTTPQDK